VRTPFLLSTKLTYSVRIAWHQTFRTFVQAGSAFITSKVFRIDPQRYTLLSRCIRLLIAFYISALVHMPGNIALGTSFFGSGCQGFFLMQAVGIIVEDAANHTYRQFRPRIPPNKIPAGGTKMLGYFWVLAWITWTGPPFFWVTARNLIPGRDETVPWSFLQWLGF
jgi:hypothetical protein